MRQGSVQNHTLRPAKPSGTGRGFVRETKQTSITAHVFCFRLYSTSVLTKSTCNYYSTLSIRSHSYSWVSKPKKEFSERSNRCRPTKDRLGEVSNTPTCPTLSGQNLLHKRLTALGSIYRKQTPYTHGQQRPAFQAMATANLNVQSILRLRTLNIVSPVGQPRLRAVGCLELR